jgi:chemotaxis protein histidine kinase CheA
MSSIDQPRVPSAGDPLDPGWLAGELREVWEEQRLRVKRRFVLIERALAALAVADLDEELRSEAERSAHALAGSVAMFGYVVAAQLARRLELELVSPAVERAPELLSLSLAARGEIDRPLRLGQAGTL